MRSVSNCGDLLLEPIWMEGHQENLVGLLEQSELEAVLPGMLLEIEGCFTDMGRGIYRLWLTLE